MKDHIVNLVCLFRICIYRVLSESRECVCVCERERERERTTHKFIASSKVMMGNLKLSTTSLENVSRYFDPD